MNLINKHLDKNNLHHAYLIEGEKKDIIPKIFEFLEDLGINTIGNSDLIQINVDSFKIEDARNLKSYGIQKSFSAGKRIFIISANSFLLEAQNSLLKIFEEPISDIHFFLIVPDINMLLRTLISRFYLISVRQGLTEQGLIVEEIKNAEKFIAMPLQNRILFIKELLTEIEEEDILEEVSKDSARSKALKFLNALEFILYKKVSKTVFDINIFKHFFKVREFLRIPGSSIKSLMESVALITPNFLN